MRDGCLAYNVGLLAVWRVLNNYGLAIEEYFLPSVLSVLALPIIFIPEIERRRRGLRGVASVEFVTSFPPDGHLKFP